MLNVAYGHVSDNVPVTRHPPQPYQPYGTRYENSGKGDTSYDMGFIPDSIQVSVSTWHFLSIALIYCHCDMPARLICM